MKAKVFGLLVAFLVSSAQAAPVITVTLDSITASQGFPGFYRWSYSATATAGMGCYPNAPETFFRILNLPGAFTSLEAPEGWQGTNITENGMLSVKFFIPDGSAALPCEAVLPAPFVVLLSASEPVFSNYEWQACGEYGNCSNTTVRGAGVVADGRRVPEPSTLALLGVGLAGLAATRRRKL